MQQKPTHLPSLLASVLFALSGLFLLGISFLMVLAALIALFTGKPVQAGRLRTLQLPLIMVMSILSVFLFAILVLSNRRMRKINSPPVSAQILPAESMDQSS